MSNYTKSKELLKSLEEIPDFRVDIGKIKYPLHEILFMVLFALLKGNTTFKDIWGWMIYNKENPILKNILQREEIKIPSTSTIHHILINTDNNALEKIFRKYFSNFIKKENIAVDGKWLKGSDVNGQYINESHKSILNILDKDTKIVFAHKFLDKNKKSEIKALQEALEEEDIFSDEGQIFSFDALHTQVETLNEINNNGNKYIAKVKGNQEELRNKIVKTIEEYEKPADSYKIQNLELSHGKKYVASELEVFYSNSIDIAMHHDRFKNIQSLIRITKELNNPITNKTTIYTEYLMANFKISAEDFYHKILYHWRVETYHYHLDMLFDEDEHIAYKEPFAIAILRSFALNLYQIFHNQNKDKKVLPTGKTTMAEIKRTCKYNDNFTIDLLEQKYIS